MYVCLFLDLMVISVTEKRYAIKKFFPMRKYESTALVNQDLEIDLTYCKKFSVSKTEN